MHSGWYLTKVFLNKLKGHGTEGEVLRWIKAWLSAGIQRVHVNIEKSHRSRVTSLIFHRVQAYVPYYINYINYLGCAITSDTSKFTSSPPLPPPPPAAPTPLPTASLPVHRGR